MHICSIYSFLFSVEIFSLLNPELNFENMERYEMLQPNYVIIISVKNIFLIQKIRKKENFKITSIELLVFFFLCKKKSKIVSLMSVKLLMMKKNYKDCFRHGR